MKKKIRKIKKEIKKEIEEFGANSKKIWTVPTFLNALRILLTFLVVYMIVIDINVILIIVVFAIAAITDWFDGRIARKYNLVNSFGAKADMIADRFLWVGVALAFVIIYGVKGRLSTLHGVQILLIMIREIIATPSAIVAVFSGKGFPKVRYVAKLTTFMQGFALPALMLSVFYPRWILLSFPLSIVVGIIGVISAFYYIYDVQGIEKGER